MKNEVIEVNRKSDIIMWIRLTVREHIINIFSMYAPQAGCTDEEKDQFWDDMGEEIEKV